MKKKLLAMLISVVMMTMMLVPSVSAATTVGGYVQDYSGNALVNYTVTMTDSAGMSQTAITDYSGLYYFSNVADGTYSLSAAYHSTANTISIVSGTIYGTTNFGLGNNNWNNGWNNGYYNGWTPSNISITHVDYAGNRYFTYTDPNNVKRYGYIDATGKYYYDTGSNQGSFSCAISFDTTGGSSITKQTYISGDSFAEPATDPVKDGYVFGGWYTNSALTDYMFSGTKIDKDMTLYARWLETQETYNRINGIVTPPAVTPTPPPAYVPPANNAPVAVPNTGDNTPIGASVILIAAGALILVFTRKKITE